jgi:DNA-binding transcriptional MocR family regulator
VPSNERHILRSFGFRGVIPIFESLHCEMIEVETDAHGISSDSLQNILESWPMDKKKPRVLYTVPVSTTSRPSTDFKSLRLVRL